MADRKFTVLCIDDDQNMLDSLKVVIEAGGFAAHQARSAKEGVAEFDVVKPDMVMVDLMMESIAAGIEAAAAIRAKAPDMPIYMLTSVGDEMLNTVDPGEVKLSGILQKPIDPQDLMKVLKREAEAKAEA